MRRRRLTSTVVGFGLAAAVFAAIFLTVDTAEVQRALAQADLGLLAVVAGLIIFWNVCWGLGLWNVLRSLEAELSPVSAVMIHVVAAFIDNVTPFGQLGGEPITAWLISRRTSVEYEVGFASITGFDAVNVVPSLSLAAVGLVYVLHLETPGANLALVVRMAAVAIVLLPILAIILWRYRERITGALATVGVRIGHILASTFSRVTAPSRAAIEGRLRGYFEALEVFGGNRYRFAAALGWSTAGWLSQAIALWVAFTAVGAAIPLYVPFLVIPLGRIAAATPTPGGLGGIEAVYITLIVLITSVSAGAAAVAVTIHSVGGYLLTVGIGASVGSLLGISEYEEALN